MITFKKLLTMFMLSGIILLTIGFFAVNINDKKENRITKEKYLNIAKEIILFIDNPNEINKTYKKYNLLNIKEDSIPVEKNIYNDIYSFGSINIFKYNKEIYLRIKYLEEIYLLKDTSYHFFNDANILKILIFLNILILFIIFIYIINLLSPLKEISEKLKKFANGNFDTRIDIKSKDEISDFGDSFNKMAEKIEDLIKRREELLCDVGHELRTPISKGIFVLEKVTKCAEKKSLKKVFKDLDTLTSDLIEMEKLRANYLNKENFDIETLIVESLSNLYIIDEEKINININENFIVNADLYYLSMALKNLIDNAIKYTTSFPIKIETSINTVTVISSGEKLNKNLEYYLDPFIQDNKIDKNKGFGLGLNIVKKILDKHNFKLDYNHISGKNHFSIILK